MIVQRNIAFADPLKTHANAEIPCVSISSITCQLASHHVHLDLSFLRHITFSFHGCIEFCSWPHALRSRESHLTSHFFKLLRQSRNRQHYKVFEHTKDLQLRPLHRLSIKKTAQFLIRALLLRKALICICQIAD